MCSQAWKPLIQCSESGKQPTCSHVRDISYRAGRPSFFVCLFSLLFWLRRHTGSSLRHVGSEAAHGLLSSCGARAPGRMGSVVCSTRALLLRCTSSVVVAHRLGCPVACGISVPQPGIEPTSLALEGGFFTTGLPGKSLDTQIFKVFIYWFSEWLLSTYYVPGFTSVARVKDLDLTWSLPSGQMQSGEQVTCEKKFM